MKLDDLKKESYQRLYDQGEYFSTDDLDFIIESAYQLGKNSKL